jgi:DNA uptake protein ComE-like DNA-binding protein
VIDRRIIEGSPCRSVEELRRVKGIGKKRLEEIRPLVTAEWERWIRIGLCQRVET